MIQVQIRFVITGFALPQYIRYIPFQPLKWMVTPWKKPVDVCTWPWESTSVASTWRRREAAGGDFNHTEGFLRL